MATLDALEVFMGANLFHSVFILMTIWSGPHRTGNNELNDDRSRRNRAYLYRMTRAGILIILLILMLFSVLNDVGDYLTILGLVIAYFGLILTDTGDTIRHSRIENELSQTFERPDQSQEIIERLDRIERSLNNR